MRGLRRIFEPTGISWARFVAYFGASFLVWFGGAAALIVLVDPYDSGRFPALPMLGISDDYQRTANVSLARSANFNAAVFGNSHVQLLDPYRLTSLTSLSFVQLATPGVNAPEQLAIMRWFIRHHHHIGAIVLGIDDRWCRDKLTPWIFPFWLYADSDVDYLRNIFSAQSVAAAYRRLRFALGWLPASDRRGYDNYELRLPTNYHYDMPPYQRQTPASEDVAAGVRASEFPGPEALAQILASVDATAAIVVIFPPRFYSVLPSGGAWAVQIDECKARIRRVVEPRGTFLDYFVDSATSRDERNFIDEEHYRSNVAREIEAAIARSIDDIEARHRQID